MKKILNIVAVASVTLAGLAAAPARAHDGYGRYGYDRQYDRHYDENDGDGRYDRDGDEYRDGYRHYRGHSGKHYGSYYQPTPRHQYRNYQAYQDGAGYRSYSHARSCHSGTTGAILGAVVGGLLGREIGRGGEYNEPSTTGLILGAGGGALAGRAIERNGCH